MPAELPPHLTLSFDTPPPHVLSEPTNPADKAKLLVYGDRGKVYGHPRENFARIAAYWSAHKGILFTPEDVAVMMVAVKLARLAETPGHADSVVDGIGYLLTYDMLKEGGSDESTE